MLLSDWDLITKSPAGDITLEVNSTKTKRQIPSLSLIENIKIFFSIYKEKKG